MVGVYVVVIGRHASRVDARRMPHRAGVLGGITSGGWLFLRTLSLRVAMLLAVIVATGLGTSELAGFQIAMTLYSTLAFALDALAIAAQALIGKALGGDDVPLVQAVLERCLQWGVGGGALLGLVLVALAWVVGPVFTTSSDVIGLLPPTLVVLGLSVPLCGYVFVLDGVLIGAGDAKYLALTGILNLVVFAPLVIAVGAWAPHDALGLALLMASFAFGYLGARAVTLGLRARGTAWMVTGAVR